MKNILTILIFLSLLSITSTITAQVPKNFVVVEIGTGTWCGYCPGAAMGADELVEHGHRVAIIENHNSDSYANTSSNTRNSYYGVTNYPTANFNGGGTLVGGNATESIYGAYVPLYETAKSVLTDFSLDMSFVKTGLDFDVTIELNEVGDYTNENLSVHLVLTESHIPENWQGMTELNFVNRGMYPNQNGTNYTGDALTINLNFTANANWNLENSELVAFVQDNTSKEILQADRVFLKTLPSFSDSLTITESLEIPDICFGTINPSFLVLNQGNNTISSMDVQYNINDGSTTGVFNWEGEIHFNEHAKVTLENIAIDLLETNTIEYTVSLINGNIDVNTSDNSGEADFDESIEISSNIVHLELHTDNYGNECNWNITDQNGTIIESGGPYGNNQTIIETFTMPGADCYYFHLIDQYGDGGGMVRLKDDADNVIYYTNGVYGAGYKQAYKTDGATGASVSDSTLSNSIIYPNPANTVLNINNAEGLYVKLFDFSGRLLFSKKHISIEEQIDLEEFSEGTYLLKLSDGNKTRTEKIIINK